MHEPYPGELRIRVIELWCKKEDRDGRRLNSFDVSAQFCDPVGAALS